MAAEYSTTTSRKAENAISTNSLCTVRLTSAGVQAMPKYATAEITPKVEPAIESFLLALFSANKRGMATKAATIVSDTNDNAVMKSAMEAALGCSPKVLVLPKSLKKLIQKE
jgi:hypothetical protein